MIKIIVSGLGNTGREIVKCINETEGVEVFCAVSDHDLKDVDFKIYPKFSDIEGKADAIIDFSKASRLEEILDYAVSTKTPVIIGTTAHSDEQNEKVKEVSKLIPVFKSSNTSIGITVMLQLVKTATRLLDGFDIEIIEKHHNRKEDCPCGTAFMTADAIKEVRNELTNIYGRHGKHAKRQPNELAIHTIRGGTIIGDNDVIFAGDDEVLEIKHKAGSNMIFAKGAVMAAKFIVNAENGLYDMNDVLLG
ncbi:4-hydroxy-tetrahydrodipicolinate reductase [Terrisporobacter mayombei]|uniref:4-hydroxy-tetrahydrodipicolinate reductase n=1 Tax=Terrisporobacter mayombei TaxID=1541 RepID=A0ABY9PY55_9FIRM|nr:4-hydroxy-tetrahydrodipicolinate reductase [Terrisporobacter mayombei]MCC3868125.1 4-hydroxy-tetrahydrodipicolinate reductase [Terrisporobacter mayombei]WMT80266.1 4-hydroxy-tetrahydrodipicolinate reductase [Terrisporobacter mayombei]